MIFEKWGFTIRPLGVCWLDLWTGAYGLEIAWNNHLVISWGFHSTERDAMPTHEPGND